MAQTRYSIPDFIADARAVLATNKPLAAKKLAIGEHLRSLSRREDLLRFGRPIGHSDASNFNWILHREEPNLMLIMVAWLLGFQSPVHEHGDYYAVGVGYRGHDRWDVYERLDDGRTPGFARLSLIDQWDVTPGKVVCMPPPPRSIHSHNNMTLEISYELLFTATTPLPPGERLIFDVERQACWPSYQTGEVFTGEWPPKSNTTPSLPRSRCKSLGRRLMSRIVCPICEGLQQFRLPRLGSQDS